MVVALLVALDEFLHDMTLRPGFVSESTPLSKTKNEHSGQNG
jgi:hypothetical protein